MRIDGNLRAITILPLVYSTRLAMNFAEFPCWDGLEIEATRQGESPAQLAERFDEQGIARILDEMASREPTTSSNRSAAGTCMGVRSTP